MCAIDDAGCGEIRSRDVFHQPWHVNIRIFDEGQARTDDLAQVVRWNIGCHTNSDSGRAVDQQVRQSRRHHGWLALGTIVILHEVDRFLVDICYELVRNLCHAHLGVTHGGCRVTIYRAEITLSVDQHVTHRKWLRHAYDCVVHG